MKLTSTMYHALIYWGLTLIILLAGCETMLPEDSAQPQLTPVSVRIQTSQTVAANIGATLEPTLIDVTPSPTPTVPPTSTPLPFELEDALDVMSGICFESALDAAGQVFVMRSAEDHINLYDLAEHSELCRRPIIRNPFDFSNGRILAGLWTAGIGCTADHEILNYVRDDDAETLTFDLRFVTDGDCPYELVRPFWVAIDDAQDYEVIINVERTE